MDEPPAPNRAAHSGMLRKAALVIPLIRSIGADASPGRAISPEMPLDSTTVTLLYSRTANSARLRMLSLMSSAKMVSIRCRTRL